MYEQSEGQINGEDWRRLISCSGLAVMMIRNVKTMLMGVA